MLRLPTIIDDAPHGTENACNGPRLAVSIHPERPDGGVRAFLVADAVGCALPGQDPHDGHRNVDRMLRAVLADGGEVRACGACAKARGVSGLQVVDGTVVGTMADLSGW